VQETNGNTTELPDGAIQAFGDEALSPENVTEPLDDNVQSAEDAVQPAVPVFDRVANLRPVLFDIFADNTAYPAVLDYVNLVRDLSLDLYRAKLLLKKSI
jgi:hypothetical protein